MEVITTTDEARALCLFWVMNIHSSGGCFCGSDLNEVAGFRCSNLA